MPTGTVKFFNVQKGFGFIAPDDGSKDVFVPAASIAASGVTELKPGLRVAFETQPDGKGPKAVDLKQIASAPPPPVVKPKPVETQSSKARVTVYLDPTSDAANDAVAELREAGLELRLVDYIANPPPADELKRLSLLLRDSDQTLVRKYDHLFLELRLDDRFISDTEYWAAIHEHPSLINGPVLATANLARVCRSESAVEAFVGSITSGETLAAPKAKQLPERLRRLLGGESAAPVIAVEDVSVEDAAEEEEPAAIPAPIKLNARPTSEPEAEPEPKPKPKTPAKAKAEPKTDAKAKPERKAVTKPKAPAKTPVKKALRKSK